MISLRTARHSALSLALVACAFLSSGGALALTVDEVANYTGSDRQKILEEGAKKEGELLWIGGLNEQTATRPILKLFMEKYPYIAAKSIRTSSAAGLQRILAEYRGKTPRVDLFNGNAVLDLKNAGLAQTIRSPLLEQYPPAFRDPERMYATVRYTYHGIVAWNTNLVSSAEAPKTFDDLLDPKWRSKIVASNSYETGLPFLVTYMRETMGDKKAAEYLEKLAKQEIRISGESIRALLDLVVAGENHMLINAGLHHVGQVKAQGAPVEASMANPVLARNDYVMILTTAPHPHATMLLIDMLLDIPAQTILKNAEFYPAHPGVDALPSMQQYTPRAKGYSQFTVDDKILFNDAAESNAMFTRLFQ